MTQRFNYQRNPLNIGAPRWGGPPYSVISALRRANQDLSDSAYMLRRRLNGLLEERQSYIHRDLFVKYKSETEQKYKELEERYKQLEAEKKTAEEQKQEMEHPKDASVKVKPDKEARSQKGVEEMLEHMKEEPNDEQEQLEQLKKNSEVLLQNYTNLMDLHGQRKCSERETDATKDQKNQEKQEQMEVEEKEKPEKKERGKWRLFRKFFAERGIEEAAEL